MEQEKKYEHGIELLKSSKYEEAMQLFESLVKQYPQEASYISERGVVHFHLGNIEAAIKDMNKAVELEPLKPYRYSSRAYILGHAGMTKKAIEDYQKAIELDPEDAVAYNNLGLLEEKLGYEEKAKRRFEIADSLVKDQGIGGRSDQEILGKALEGRNIQKEIDDENKEEPKLWNVLKSIGSKEGRESFGRFIRSGFKQT